ncbi:5'-methylthioadenosine/S-adenosylhomocysteine nucleosidase [Spiroplasma tabanidicola]|uniref:Adenosylhomocysteine nucleosidase n=1 Tax=Spiroplasma tabanidicola TaxID=324079 RepID=A0A6I6C9F9_9MOLU|nr:5'-methylthioadenosine/S-adenosylhomocysteine nucleosidase [Spiroplasma tabanidicola]QGS52089.1 adenosylhomocysteine nucleosidase [Spiroplasma tabanidicola]
MSKVCVLFAMEQEAEDFIGLLEAEQITSDPFLIYKKDKVLIAISGIGIVNAATCLTYLNSEYENIDLFINSGLVGCINSDFKRLDKLLVSKAYYGAANATGFGYAYGQIPKMPRYFTSDSIVNKEFKSFIGNIEYTNIATSDIFISKKEQVEFFVNKIGDKIDVVDMECNGFFQAAYNLNKPIISFKIVSDTMSEEPNEFQFSEILAKAQGTLANDLIKYVKHKKYTM